MPPRNHKNWIKEPNVEYVSSEIYSSQEIFEQEIEHIFSKVWVPVCHASEMDMTGCFRTTQIAFQNIIVIRSLIKLFKDLSTLSLIRLTSFIILEI